MSHRFLLAFFCIFIVTVLEFDFLGKYFASEKRGCCSPTYSTKVKVADINAPLNMVTPYKSYVKCSSKKSKKKVTLPFLDTHI